MRDRQSHLDAIRGIAGLVIVLLHFLAAFYPYSIFGSQASYQQQSSWEDLAFIPPFGLFVAGRPAVCLFFILSGYVLSFSHLGQPGRTAKLIAAIMTRPIRLGGLMWFTMIAAALIWYLDGFHNASVAALSNSKPWFIYPWLGPFQPEQFFIDLFTASFSRGLYYNAPLWTIEIELYGSIMVYLFLLLVGKFKYRWVLCLALIVIFRTSLYQGFWLGLLIADLVKHQHLRASTNVWPPLLLFGLATFFACNQYFVTQEFRASNTIYGFLPSDQGFDTGYPMLAALLLFLSLKISLQFQRGLTLPLLQYFGRISYALYVIHFIVLGSLASWMFLTLNQYFPYGYTFIVVFVSNVMVIVGLSHILTRWIDEPTIQFSRYLQKKIVAWFKPLRAALTGA
jgi:peptidoglycan/LPS O-acetylase OafA/YrhL